MARPIVAIVGRPNVGKSTLFNKLCGQRLAIVEDTPGVTRDRLYASCEWRGKEIMLVDTGGIEPFASDVIFSQMRRQAEIAIATAQVILLITDLKAGVTANDVEVSQLLIKSGKPILLCVNKCDRIGDPPPEFYEFYNLGLGDPIAISAQHGSGTGDLLDEIFDVVDFDIGEDYDEEYTKVAIIGKPNVGKSSLVNRMSGEDRAIVSNIAGTTRDALDTIMENSHGKYVLIDTAGIRRKSKVEEAIERYSVLRAYMAVDRADVCLIMIDATEGFTEQDSKIAGYAHDSGKASVVVVNKWDAIEKDEKTMQEYEKKLKEDFAFMSYVPFLFISALTGQRVEKIYEIVNYVHEQNCRRITTGMLNDVLANATARVQPPTDKGKRLKIYYITQSAVKPPTFVSFVNSADLFHFSYQRYLENQIRDTFGFDGTPIKMVVRERGGGKDQ